MKTIEVDGARLAYSISGNGNRAIAFAHGWCSMSAHWQAQVEYFAPTRRVICWDRRGMGASTCGQPAESPARHADDLLAILDHEGIERVTVVGHAGGGPSALTFATRHAARTAALVMVDTRLNGPTSSGRPSGFAFGVEKMIERLGAPDSDTFFAATYAGYFGRRAAPDVVAAAVANALATPRTIAAAEVSHMVGDTAALAGEVRCPVLWVSAMADDSAPVRAAFERVTIGHVVGSGHFVQVEVPEQLNLMIEAFLADELG